MNSMTTLGKVQEVLEEQSAAHWDDLIPVTDMEFVDLSTIEISGSKHQLQPAAQRTIAQRLGVPLSYLQRCDTDLQQINLNTWLPKERNERLFLRFDGDSVRAIFTPRYTPVDHLAVLQQLREQRFVDRTPVQCKLDNEMLLLSIPDRENAFHVKKNDEIQPGISIVNSEVGVSSLTISAFCLRLVCTNGLISRTSVDSSYRHISDRVLHEFPSILENVNYSLQDSRNSWQISINSPVVDSESTLRSFNSRYGLDKRQIEAVEWAYPQEQGDSMFHIVNTYTKAAQYDPLNAEQSAGLQRTGGMVLAMLN
ncbi:MAG: DUF932 domain-containing protein [Candidatus Hinthialibacter antarcticus]|nr:DUF932 domain-containing protein [Candidatus Hinthialibacter antarcticus]